MSYKIQLSPTANKQLRKLDRTTQKRLGKIIDSLAENPFPKKVKKLADSPLGENLFRVRVGDYRIIYEIHFSILVVSIILIGDRKEIYR